MNRRFNFGSYPRGYAMRPITRTLSGFLPAAVARSTPAVACAEPITSPDLMEAGKRWRDTGLLQTRRRPAFGIGNEA